MKKKIDRLVDFTGELSVEMLKTSTILFGIALVGKLGLDIYDRIKEKRNKK